ncbi:MAG: hypothetical protein JWN36_107 [Microbacteriaceae bacterium]|nr:hypothetical protein [Microbacteriaceae bacterium]
MNDVVAILGATGRTGRGIARAVSGSGHAVVLAGRDRARLEAVAAELPGARVVVGTFEEILTAMAELEPTIVVNTVGPFERTSPQAIDALPDAHHLDLANDPIAARAVLDRGDAARSRGRTLVTGAGFGVLATEAPAIRVCAGRPAPASIRVDAMASVAGHGDALGEALAATIIEGVASMGRIPARERRDWPPFGANRERITTPDGDELVSVGFPSGDWVAAGIASSAASVFAGSTEAPSSPLIPLVLPLAQLLLRSARLRRSLVARLARTPIAESASTRASWGRARAEWADGTVRTVWLRTPDGMDFTVSTAAEVVRRLALGEGRPGAFTPGALFGADLAVAAGGAFVE